MLKILFLREQNFPGIQFCSLVVQLLGLGAFTALAGVQSLVGELRPRKLHGLAKKKKKKNSVPQCHDLLRAQ